MDAICDGPCGCAACVVVIIIEINVVQEVNFNTGNFKINMFSYDDQTERNFQIAINVLCSR